MFDQNNVEALKLLYQLYHPVKDGLKPISDKFKIQLTEQGSRLIKTTETTKDGKDMPIKMILLNSEVVQKIIEMLAHYKRMLATCFQDDSNFERQMMLSF